MSCICYHADKNFLGEIGVCWGTKECEACTCNGDEEKCDFYDYVRARAKKIAIDYIRRDAVLAIFDDIHPLDHNANAYLSQIKEIPIADVRPIVHGLWKRVDPRSTVETFRCSECNYYVHMRTSNFCPNCGAEMGCK